VNLACPAGQLYEHTYGEVHYLRATSWKFIQREKQEFEDFEYEHTYADFEDFEDLQLYEHIYAHRKTLKTLSRPEFFKA
jgi:hypothetical protein